MMYCIVDRKRRYYLGNETEFGHVTTHHLSRAKKFKTKADALLYMKGVHEQLLARGASPNAWFFTSEVIPCTVS